MNIFSVVIAVSSVGLASRCLLNAEGWRLTQAHVCGDNTILGSICYLPGKRNNICVTRNKNLPGVGFRIKQLSATLTACWPHWAVFKLPMPDPILT